MTEIVKMKGEGLETVRNIGGVEGWGVVVSSPDQIFRARPVDSSKNRVWTLSLRKLGQVYLWQSIDWVLVGFNYIISHQ